jgi:hypothetical protein
VVVAQVLIVVAAVVAAQVDSFTHHTRLQRQLPTPLSWARVGLDLQARDEEVTEAIRPYRFFRCLQPAAVLVVAYQVSKRAAMEDAVAAHHMAAQVQLAEQEAKDLTAALSPTSSRHLLVQVAVALVQSALTAAEFAVLAEMVRPTLVQLTLAAVVLENLLALDALAVAAAAGREEILLVPRAMQTLAAAAGVLVATIQLAEEAAARVVLAS